MADRTSSDSETWIDDHEWGSVPTQTRRRLLGKAFGGGAALAGLAGCMGGEEGDGTSSEPDTTAETTDTSDDSTLDIITQVVPQDAQFNWYAPSHHFDDLRWGFPMWDMLAVHDQVANKTKGMILKEWSFNDDGTVTWVLRDTYTWHDGSDLVAEDLVTQLKIGQLMGLVHKGWGTRPAYENVEATGKYELQFELLTPDMSPELFMWGHAKRESWLWAHRDNWGKYADLYDDATTDDALADAQTQLTNEVKAPITDSSVLPGNSVWNPTAVEGQTLRFEPYDDYYSPYSEAEWAEGEITGDQVDYTLESTYFPNQQQRTQAMSEELLDISYPPLSDSARQDMRDIGFEPAESFPVEQINPRMRDLSIGYRFNMQDPITGDRRVRKAIAHVVPRKPLASWNPSYEEYWMEDRYYTGLGQDMEVLHFGGDAEGWPNDTLESFEQYAHTQEDVDTERATQLLEDAGWTKQDGRWHDADGEPVTLQLYTMPTNEDNNHFKVSQRIKAFLNEFGLRTQMTAEEASIRNSETLESGDWHMMASYPGSIIKLALKDFELDFPFRKNWSGDSIDVRREWGMDETVEVPYPVGDPDGDLEQVNVYEKMRRLQTKLSEEERGRLVEEVAWIYNQSIPLFAVSEEGGIGGYWMNKSRWRTYGPQDGENPVFRYLVIEVGEYSYAQYAAKFGTDWFGPTGTDGSGGG
ncbi:ABC transporter substrate-binding protein [Candidatus Halobonum tyrrellensis]|nr:ABC transporter substrate-binding protein [Candidatus Halobonum tyrrellensis]